MIDAIRRDSFEEKLGWTHGLDFQVAALQATNAGQLHGHMLHAAFGLAPFMGPKRRGKKDLRTGQEI